MFLLAYLLDPSKSVSIFSRNSMDDTGSLVYYRDGALRLHLPLRENFKRETAEPTVIRLIKSARLMLANEQLRAEAGNQNDGQILVHQIIGRI